MTWNKLCRVLEMLEKAGFKMDPLSDSLWRCTSEINCTYDVVTMEDLYNNPIMALKNVGINFLWKDDDVTEVISRDKAKEIFGNEVTKCQHKWKTYTGLNEVDTFCEKCQEKQK